MAYCHSMTKCCIMKETKNKEIAIKKNVCTSHAMNEGHSMTKSSLLEETKK